MTTTIARSRTRFRVLDPGDEQYRLGADLRAFPLRIPAFTPVSGEPLLEDDVPPTKLGARAIKAIAELNEVAPKRVPTGLIRLIEALNADTDANLTGFAHPRPVRNQFGVIWGVDFVAHTPLLLPNLMNGRVLRRLAAAVRGNTNVITHAVDHDALHLIRVPVESPEQVLDLASAQRTVLNLVAYKGPDRDFIDDILLNGILDPMIVAPTQLVGQANSTDWVAFVTEGARRTSASHEALRSLLGLDPVLVTHHWQDGRQLDMRHLRAEDVEGLQRLLAYQSADLPQPFPSSGSDRALTQWLATVGALSPEVRAFHRVRTAPTFLVLAVRPHADVDMPNPVAEVLAEDVRSRHIPNAAKKPWADEDVHGLIAIKALDDLAEAGHFSEPQRRALVGLDEVGWADEGGRSGRYRNQVTAVTSLLAVLTTRDDATRLRVVHNALRANRAPVGPKSRATVASAQAQVLLACETSTEGRTIAAALRSTFDDDAWWKVDEHPGQAAWPTLLEEDVDDLLSGAQQELATGGGRGDDGEGVGTFGPHQRALGAMGAVALETNPKLVEASNQLTMTGRGATGGYAKNASKVIRAMMADLDGLEQLAEGIRASIGAEVRNPLDPDTREPMVDLWLRKRWIVLGSGSDTTGAGNAAPEADPLTQYLDDVTGLVTKLAKNRDIARELAARTIPGEEEEESFFARHGVPPEQAKAGKKSLGILDEFLGQGRRNAGDRGFLDE